MVLDNTAGATRSERSVATGAESYYHLPSLLHCMSYIDTQGLSAPSDKPINHNIQYKPMQVKKMRIFNDMERDELKQMMREVLDEYVEAGKEISEA